MLKKTLLTQARRKHGQTAWSPNATSSGAAPATGLTMQEALQVAYRPMPPAQTVEYEEDFGRNMLIHREFVSKKYRKQMSFDVAGLAYSEVELRRGQQRLADTMNRERRGVLTGSGGASDKDRVVFDADLGGDDQAGSVASARYLFDERRMAYCDRFQERMRAVAKTAVGADPSKEDAEDSQVLFSVMEACAIVHGCDSTAAQEAYYHMFGGLDLESLEEAAAALAEREADARKVKDDFIQLQQKGEDGAVRTGGVAQVQQIIDAMPSLFDGDMEEQRATLPLSATTHAQLDTKASGESTPSPSFPDVDVPEAFAPLYKSYLAHARGESPLPSHDAQPVVATEDLQERRVWRNIMDKLVREDYASITRDELRAAAKLDEQLHTVKFMDLKVGDTVKEIVALLQRETGDGSSVDRTAPLEVSSSHPERRV